MLLSILAFATGSAIGVARGGSWLGVTSARLHGKGFLVMGIAATLVLNILSPSLPMFWLLLSIVGFAGFAIANLAMTGMIVLLIGMSLNILPIIANGSVPVSEAALQSVGVVDESGAARIDGPRESTEVAGSLAFLGDVVPVPIVDKVVSLGDLIMLVAIADIATNLFLRRRRTEASGVTESERSFQGHGADEPALDLSDDIVGAGPAHAAPGRRLFSAPLPKVRPVRLPVGRLHRPSAESGTPRHAATDRPDSVPTEPAVTPVDVPPEMLDLTDRRPIIDLTVSPTDEQLAEFLRRRAEADSQLGQLAPPSPGHRRYRSRVRRRRGELADNPG